MCRLSRGTEGLMSLRGNSSAAGEDVDVMVGTDESAPVTETSFALEIGGVDELVDGEAYTFAFEMLDAEDRPVTVTATARWTAG